jgi:hypothetical protein
MSNKVIKNQNDTFNDYNLPFHRIDNDEPYRASPSPLSGKIDAQAVVQESLAVGGATVLPFVALFSGAYLQWCPKSWISNLDYFQKRDGAYHWGKREERWWVE